MRYRVDPNNALTKLSISLGGEGGGKSPEPRSVAKARGGALHRRTRICEAS